MARYTERNKKGIAMIPGVPQTYGLIAIDVFAKYEDTNLTPDQVQILKNALELAEQESIKNITQIFALLSSMNTTTKKNEEIRAKIINILENWRG